MDLVRKQVFELPVLETVSGRRIAPVRVGWESYGALNADRSNAILVCHYFSGTSHAAGRYRAGALLPGYWDDLIGPGKAIDTNRFFVLSSDTLVNVNAGDPDVVTTGPASIDPETGKPWGLRFPIVTIRDFVNVQKALVESLGITKLHAVVGPSMGGLQTYEWAMAFPDMMTRIMPVIASGVASSWLGAWLDTWAQPIRLDPQWRGGDYDRSAPPLDGLTAALRNVTLHALHWDWSDATFGRRWAVDSDDPLTSFDHVFAVEAALQQAAAARAAVADANHFLYLVRANQTHAGSPERLAQIRVPALLLYAPGDQIFPGIHVLETAGQIRKGGATVETGVIEGPLGHLNGLSRMGPCAPQIRAFLER